MNKEFYFIRHGQTDWNLKHIPMGSRNIGLNQTGIEQAHKAKEMVSGYIFNTIISSPLDRALQTARILNASSQKIHIIDELKEACWGEMEARPSQSFDWLEQWVHGKSIKGAETYADFKKRVTQGLHKTMAYPGPILMVSHGVVYWAIQDILGLEFKDVPNAIPIYHRPPPINKGNGQWIACSLDKPTCMINTFEHR